MPEKYECPLCKGDMEVKSTSVVADTEYKMLRCKKCHHQVARSKK